MSDIDKTLCDEAIKIVTGARREKYDVPERNFERIALAWQAITDRAYTAQEVALMFVALKLVRESHEHQRDNLVDGIGYLLCADAVRDQGVCAHPNCNCESPNRCFDAKIPPPVEQCWNALFDRRCGGTRGHKGDCQFF